MIAHIHKFREKLARGQICLGAGISFVDPAVTEALCDSVDFVWIDLEHTPIGVESLQSHLIAARAGGAPALVRVPSSDPAWAKRVLDIGAEGVIVPQVRSAQEVQAFVSACRYPPLGSRGFGPRRPSNYGRQGGKAFLDQANRDVFVVVQIETAQAVRAVKEILAVPTVDSLVIGPNDLSGSLGHPGEPEHADVLAAIRETITASRAARMPVGIGMGPDADHAARAAELGVNWVQCGGDASYMVRYADQLFSSIRKKLETT
jgi:4-hydroxy-2-oxoheptanedioate aldolase